MGVFEHIITYKDFLNSIPYQNFFLFFDFVKSVFATEALEDSSYGDI